jgi:uncharacterized protein YdeI (YjbR/CyaY-like superfamily)
VSPTFFAGPADLRAWLEEHHASERELWAGFHKKGTGRPSVTWPEAVDQALCFGWIDGKRKSLGAPSYMIRFSPRKPRSTWSAVNVKRIGELIAEGLVHPAGLVAFEARSEDRTGTYSYENRDSAKLEEAQEQRFRANAEAWEYFQARPAWYRRTAIWWVVSAKRAATRERRLTQLIGDSAARRTIGPLTRPGS